MVRPAYSDINDTLFFSAQGEEARSILAADCEFKRVFELVPEVAVDVEGDGFIALARAIVDQQISIHAARAIWGRLIDALGGVLDPKVLVACDDDQLRAVGLSNRKASYLKDLSQRILSGEIDFAKLESMDNEDVISSLISVKGIGRWTAEMYLIFSLKRLDVFALDDGGLRRAVAALHNLPSDVPTSVIDDFAQQWAPYRTVAALFLWKWHTVAKRVEKEAY